MSNKPLLQPLTKDESETVHVYTALMNEVKIRMDAFNWLVGGRSGLSGPIIRESCFLQLRFMCELIALGCLVAHGDINSTKSTRLKDEYAPDKILKQLGQLHPDFYPFPATVTN
jgi:hypothetical protein